MPEKTLPTRTDAIAVRPESLPTPVGKAERRELRTVNSKTFLHAEKAADGKELRTCQAQIGAVCYVSDDGSLRSIDTTIRDLGTHVGVEWAPYKFTLHSGGIGFDFESREGGRVSITLIGIGGEKFDTERPLTPDIVDNTITFRDVRPGCDIVFKCLNQRVKTLRILRDADAPREFAWQVDSDKPDLIDSTLFGTDAAGNQLELVATVNGAVITETWTGKAKVILDPATRIRSLSDGVTYPVEIDPTVNAGITNDADDGCNNPANNNWIPNASQFGKQPFLTVYDAGFRFQSITVPQGSTINSATLTLNAFAKVGTPGGSGTLYGANADNQAVWATSGPLPKNVSKTTATASMPGAGATGSQVHTVTSIVQEVVNRVGWASGNSISFAAISSAGTGHLTYYTNFTGGSHANEPSLSITYTEPAAGGTAKNLLLLGCG